MVRLVEQLLSLSGRAARLELLRSWFIVVVAVIVIFYAFSILSPLLMLHTLLSLCFFLLCFVIVGVAVCIVFATHIRRLHDIGLSGWNLLWFLAPGINIALWFMLCIVPSDKGENKYGMLPQNPHKKVAFKVPETPKHIRPHLHEVPVHHRYNNMRNKTSR